MTKKDMKMMTTAITALLLLLMVITIGIAEAGTITLRMATGAKPMQRFYKAAEKWISLVEERTNGAVKIKSFHSGQLYDYHELDDVLVAGDMDLALATPGTFGKLAPSHALDWIDWGGPPLDRGWKLLRKLYEHPDFIATINDRFQELGVKLLFYAPHAIMWGPLTVDKPVRSIEDMKGLLIYTPSPNVAALIKALGGKTVFVPTGEVYTALQRGTFQGALSLQELYLVFHLYEEAKYLTDYVYNGGMMPFFISLKAWNKLPKDVQKVMVDAAQEVQAEWFTTQVKFDQGISAKLGEKLEIIPLTPEEKARWDKAMMATHEKFAATNARTQKVWKLWKEIKSSE